MRPRNFDPPLQFRSAPPIRRRSPAPARMSQSEARIVNGLESEGRIAHQADAFDSIIRRSRCMSPIGRSMSAHLQWITRNPSATSRASRSFSASSRRRVSVSSAPSKYLPTPSHSPMIPNSGQKKSTRATKLPDSSKMSTCVSGSGSPKSLNRILLRVSATLSLLRSVSSMVFRARLTPARPAARPSASSRELSVISSEFNPASATTAATSESHTLAISMIVRSALVAKTPSTVTISSAAIGHRSCLTRRVDLERCAWPYREIEV